MTSAAIPPSPAAAPARVLLVEDDPLVGRALSRQLGRLGYEVAWARDGITALDKIGEVYFDAIVSDLGMPNLSGIELLERISDLGLDTPVILMTGAPGLDTAVRALELGAKRYLSKPIHGATLRQAVVRAIEESRSKRRQRSSEWAINGLEMEELDLAFGRALASLEMAYQPIVSWRRRNVFAYEALVRTSEPQFRGPPDLLAAAERLGKLHRLGRRIRTLVAERMAGTPRHHRFFVNLHPDDLTDPDIYDPSAPLSAYSDRVVLEITERASLEGLHDLRDRLNRLRALGYSIAVDDLGAGYAGLTSFVKLQPEIVKIDMTLVRGINADTTLQSVVRSLLDLCNTAGVLVVLEGVETAAEARTLHDMGVQLMQGYGFARPQLELVEIEPNTFELLAADGAGQELS